MKSFLLYLFLLINLLTNFVTAEIILPADIVEGQDSNKNYIKEKAHFEKNVNGWSAYADSAATRPVDGTGGSPTITCTRSTTTPITGDGSLIITKDAANRQGQGCAAQFTIGNEMKAKVMQVEIDYRVVSGTFAAGTSTTDSDLIVYIYDVTNSTLIEPTSIKFFSTSTTIPDKMVTNFQTSATGTTYKLIIHHATTSASAFVLMLDNIKTTASRYVYGTPITDWAEYIPTFTGLGTPTISLARWRRVGQNSEIDIRATSGTVTGSNATFTLPSGQTVDYSGATSIVGFAATQSTTYPNPSVIWENGNATNILSLANGNAASSGFTQLTGTNVGNTTILSLKASVKISGWSSSVQQSDGYDGRQIGARYYNSASSISGSASTITFTTREQDDTNSYSGGTYTVPSPGWYRTSAGLQLLYTSAADVNNSIAIFVDGSERTRTQSNTQRTTANDYVKVDDTIYLRAGQLVTIRASSSGTSPSINSDNARNFFSIVKSQAPTTISATEFVGMSYSNTAGTTFTGTFSNVPFATKSYDSHNAWNGTDTYTCPVAGFYSVQAAINFTFGAYTAGHYAELNVTKNASTLVYANTWGANATVSNYLGLTASTVVQCNAGETIKLTCRNDASRALNTGAGYNTITITRIK